MRAVAEWHMAARVEGTMTDGTHRYYAVGQDSRYPDGVVAEHDMGIPWERAFPPKKIR